MGTGKTTLARYFLSKLGPDTHSAFVLYPALSAEELLKTVLDDLHVTPKGDSKKSLVDALHRFLLEARASKHNVVLLIDEAQDLSPEVLEQVRLISNLETDTEKLIQADEPAGAGRGAERPWGRALAARRPASAPGSHGRRGTRQSGAARGITWKLAIPEELAKDIDAPAS